MLKQILAFFLTATMVITLTACDVNSYGQSANSDESFSEAEFYDSQDKTEGEIISDQFETEEDRKVLTVYFSCSGTTEQLAQYVSAILGADLYKITPEEPYSEQDLAYYTNGRADKEQADASIRPAISSSVENMGQYDICLLYTSPSPRDTR